MAEKVRRRTVRLKGLGASLKDTIGDLNDVASIAKSAKDKRELARLVRDLQKLKDEVKELCRSWSRSFDVYE
jgi:Mg2+ and Co2+ transporter CorA